MRFKVYCPSAIFFMLLFLFSANSCTNIEPITIGATMSLSGPYATQGTAAANGYLLCVEHINREGGLLGRPVELILYDDESLSDKAVELYRKLIEEDEVDLVLGPYGSTLTEAVAHLAEEYRMVMISPLAATSSIWEQGREFLFMVLPPADLFLSGLIEIAFDNGLHKVALLHENQLFPNAAGVGAAGLVAEREMELVFHQSYESGYGDFSGIIEEIRKSEAQVLGMAASALDDFIRFVKQMHKMELELMMFGTSGAVLEFSRELEDKAEGTLGLSAWEPSLPYPGIDDFTSSYSEKYDIAPSFHAAGAYGSFRLLEEAIENSGSLDSEILREKLLQMETTTIFSQYKVDERGFQTANQGVFIQWQNGEKVVVWPPDLATGSFLPPSR